METLIYDKLGDKAVQCNICHHFCIIKEGKKGICKVKENSKGRLISLVYPRVVANSVDPIEKKPLFHLKPGSYSYSIATMGCNFKCSFCQNSNIAQVSSAHHARIHGQDMLPETIVKEALNSNCASISYTYTEPTIFCELALETAILAKEKRLFNIFVTNGYMSTKLLEMLSPYLDAANVDLKSFNNKFYQTYCKARLEPVKENIIQMKKMGILVEITTLLIPGLNDDPADVKAMARFIANDVGRETPWHISRFHPCYKMTDRPQTPVADLDKVYNAGKAAGLKYVYIGNVPGQSRENTCCHSCGELLIERYAYNIKNHMKNPGRCPECGTIVFGIY
ncbi:MAG: AmmeMemoRadiSam system radical SAM enzyme [Desulfobacula sp.]|nr:AmmeMemoRadiSam system radical SAM enzyme [Desulfobacula sp.]